jgi:hypothetical protein
MQAFQYLCFKRNKTNPRIKIRGLNTLTTSTFVKKLRLNNPAIVMAGLTGKQATQGAKPFFVALRRAGKPAVNIIRRRSGDG